MKFQEKPKVVDARKFDGDTDNLLAVADWVIDHGYVWFEMFTPAPPNGITMNPTTGFLGVMSEDGLKYVEKGDWLYVDNAGKVKAEKADVFEALYEPIDDPAPVDPVTPDPVAANSPEE